MKVYILFILFFILNVSCSKKDESYDDILKITPEYLLQALQKGLSIQDIKETSGSYKIVFSDNSKVTFVLSKGLFYTKIEKNYWCINGENTNIKASNTNAELWSMDVDTIGNWIINEGRTNIAADMPLDALDAPTIKNIVQSTNFFYFYFTDKTLLRFVNQKNGNQTNHDKQPLPVHPKSLKILCIGNSFTEDATNILPNIIQSAGINNICIGRLLIGGGYLKQYYNNYMNNSSEGYYQITDDHLKWKTISEKFTLKRALQYADWDIITFQQVSYEAGRFQTYQPYLSNLIDIAKKECKNSTPVFVWQMSWAYGTGCTEEVFGRYGYNQMKMYNDIINATKIMMGQSDIDIVVPIGTAIQNLRNTPLGNPPLDITRDFRHLDQGVGIYTASCTFFQALIAPVYDIQIFETPFLRLLHGSISVTENNFRICQQAAVNACNMPFHVTK